MKIASTKVFPAVAILVATVCGQAALAEEFRMLEPGASQACQSGTKSETMTLDAPTEVTLAQAEGDVLDAAVCVDAASAALVQLSWRAGGNWSNSGNVSHGCAQVVGASTVTVRPIESDFQGTATYFTCVKQ